MRDSSGRNAISVMEHKVLGRDLLASRDATRRSDPHTYEQEDQGANKHTGDYASSSARSGLRDGTSGESRMPVSGGTTPRGSSRHQHLQQVQELHQSQQPNTPRTGMSTAGSGGGTIMRSRLQNPHAAYDKSNQTAGGVEEVRGGTRGMDGGQHGGRDWSGNFFGDFEQQQQIAEALSRRFGILYISASRVC